MIVWSGVPMEIGHVFDSGASGIIDAEGTKHYLPTFIVREATRDEWQKEYESDGGKVDADATFACFSRVYFYEVSID